MNPFTKYALLMNPLARSIEELLPDRMSENIWCFLLLRTALVASSVCSAFLIPFFGKNIKLERLGTHSLVFLLLLNGLLLQLVCFPHRSYDGSYRISSQYTRG